MTSIGSMKKSDFYDFDFSEEQLEEAKTRTWENPLLINDDAGYVTSLFYTDGKLRINCFVSYYGFEEGLGKHKAKEFDNVVLCSCGKRFPQGKRKLGMQNFEKHSLDIQKLKENAKQS